uniref:Copper transport protein n=2 Tax=Spongospora subterranea TaxID=70186 RepID=A0A0H5R4K6_9EUKA|eukprot:CRZ08821.1 hypothetical protein [Spongospora subterranea]
MSVSSILRSLVCVIALAVCQFMVASVDACACGKPAVGAESEGGTFFAWGSERKLDVLFSFWRIQSTSGYVWSMIAIFLMGFLFEGLQTLQQFVDRKMASRSTECCCESEGLPIKQVEDTKMPGSSQSTPKAQYTKGQECIRALFHMTRVFSSLMLMLIFMLFEWGTSLALVFGAGAGYLFFNIMTPMPSGQGTRQAGCH